MCVCVCVCVCVCGWVVVVVFAPGSRPCRDTGRAGGGGLLRWYVCVCMRVCIMCLCVYVFMCVCMCACVVVVFHAVTHAAVLDVLGGGC